MARRRRKKMHPFIPKWYFDGFKDVTDGSGTLKYLTSEENLQFHVF